MINDPDTTWTYFKFILYHNYVKMTGSNQTPSNNPPRGSACWEGALVRQPRLGPSPFHGQSILQVLAIITSRKLFTPRGDNSKGKIMTYIGTYSITTGYNN